MKEVKLYQVTFNEYLTNSFDASVEISTAHTDLSGMFVDERGLLMSSLSNDRVYTDLEIPHKFVIKESEIEYYKQFGNGIKELTYVGSMLEPELDSEEG